MDSVHLYREEELLKDLQQGSIRAYECMFKMYWRPLFNIAHGRLRSEQEAKEVVQELFVKVWEKRESLRITSNLSGYLHTAVRHRVLNKIRGKLREEKNWSFYQQYLPVQSECTKDTVLYNDLNNVINDVVGAMPRKSQLIFKGSWVDGKSIQEIADQMQLSEKTIEYHLTKSMKSIRVHLKKLVFLFLFFPFLGN